MNRLIGSAMTTGDSPVEVLVVARGPSLADALPGLHRRCVG